MKNISLHTQGWPIGCAPLRGPSGAVAELLRVGLAALVFVVFTAVAGRAEAIPVFARRYRTTCQTCHVAFPALTPFGEAFRRNGYRFPGGADEDYQRQEPVALGASAYRDIFPRSVWPGELAGAAPMSAFFTSGVHVLPNDNGTLEAGGLQGSFGLNAVAPVGNLLTLWAGASLDFMSSFDVAVRLGRVFAVLTPFRHPWATLRLGRMEPSVLSFSGHRMWGFSCYPWMLVDFVGNNQFQMESPLLGSGLGAEVTGVLARGRLTYTAGLRQTPGMMEFPRMVYGRLGYKLGGMRLDGETSDAEPNLADPAPWRERSVQVGAFGMAGEAPPAGARTGTPMDPFVLAGIDVNTQLGSLNLITAYTLGRSHFPLASDYQLAPNAPGRAGVLADPSRWTGVFTHNVMVQASYVVFPWFVPAVRYEWQRRASESRDPWVTADCERTGSALTNCGSETRDRFVGFLTFLMRANVRAMLVATVQRTVLGETQLEHVVVNLMAGY